MSPSAAEGVDEEREHAHGRRHVVDDDVAADVAGVLERGDVVAAELDPRRRRRIGTRDLLPARELGRGVRLDRRHQLLGEREVLRRVHRLRQQQQQPAIGREEEAARQVDAQRAAAARQLGEEDFAQPERIDADHPLGDQRLRGGERAPDLRRAALELAVRELLLEAAPALLVEEQERLREVRPRPAPRGSRCGSRRTRAAAALRDRPPAPRRRSRRGRPRLRPPAARPGSAACRRRRTPPACGGRS